MKHGKKYVDSAKVKNSLVADGCVIEGCVENSILFSGVTVERGAHICGSIIMNDTEIKEGASVRYSIIDGDTKVGARAVIGEDKAEGGKVTLIGGGLEIKSDTVIPAGAMVNCAYINEHKKV